jgi:hypothetical protein
MQLVPRVKRPGREADYSLPTSAEGQENVVLLHSLPHMIPLRSVKHGGIYCRGLLFMPEDGSGTLFRNISELVDDTASHPRS